MSSANDNVITLPTCGNCPFSFTNPDTKVLMDRGGSDSKKRPVAHYCRRFPPTVAVVPAPVIIPGSQEQAVALSKKPPTNPGVISLFPQVSPDGVCGEHPTLKAATPDEARSFMEVHKMFKTSGSVDGGKLPS